MIHYYKTVQNVICPLEGPEPGCWVNLINPSDEEVNQMIDQLHLDAGFLRAALDEEETSRIEVEEDQTLLIIDVPTTDKDGERMIYSTLPMGIIVTEQNIVTVCLKDTSILADLASGRVKNVQTAQKTRFILLLLLRAANRYLLYLRQIERISSHIEHQLYKSLKNKELIQLLGLEKSLVYFSTSLKATEVTLEKVLRGRIIKLYEEDQDLLEDVLVEIRQAIEMANIYTSILSGTMDAFASVISNNLNIIMKVLTVITILMTIPNIVFSYYGMNVEHLPLPVFWFPLVLAAVITLITWLILKIKKLY